MSVPLLSVVVLNWNAREYITGCLRSVLKSDYPNFEVILVDNCSGDGSVEALKEALRPDELVRLRIVVNDANYGAARALNQGAALASGKYISFIATDTRVDPACFAEIVKVMEKDPLIGGTSAALLMMQEPGRFDSAGEYLSSMGLLLQRHAGQEIDRGQFKDVEEIFSAKGTALTVRAEAFRAAGMYPEDYFMFLEETDLCWRIWLAGYRIVFVPTARIYHASGVSIKAHTKKNYIVKYYGARNYVYTLMKNFGALNWLRIVPLHCAMWYALALVFILKLRFAAAAYIVRGVSWNIFHAGRVLRQRAAVQSRRAVSDKELMPRVMRRVSLSYLVARVGGW